MSLKLKSWRKVLHELYVHTCNLSVAQLLLGCIHPLLDLSLGAGLKTSFVIVIPEACSKPACISSSMAC